MAHTVVMTGATRGIGRVAVDHILEKDPAVHLVILGRGATTTTLAGELSASGRAVSSIVTDLQSMGSVNSAAQEVCTKLDSGELPPLRGLIGNAGLQYTNDLTESTEGFEATFAVNVLANHVLLRGLQHHFRTPSRIVITVSDTHFGDFKHNMGMVPAPQWRSPGLLARTGTFDRPGTVSAGRTAYSTSKLAAIYLIHEYARRLPPGVDVIGYNPGFVPGTGLARDAGPVARFAMKRLLPVMTLTPMATGRNAAGRYLADLAVSATPAPSGSYVDRNTVDDSSPESYDVDRERELWATVEELTRRWCP
jgi:NAD(P)-dependent dehydrogenase (short-subunit alcohol dehydrogenase family)